MDANSVASRTDASATATKAAMSRDLEAQWARFADNAAGMLDQETLAMMEKMYWYGVTTGVGVFCKAVDGAYP
jgi:hypothetical protein